MHTAVDHRSAFTMHVIVPHIRSGLKVEQAVRPPPPPLPPARSIVFKHRPTPAYCARENVWVFAMYVVFVCSYFCVAYVPNLLLPSILSSGIHIVSDACRAVL